jgi:hypothetical protein
MHHAPLERLVHVRCHLKYNIITGKYHILFTLRKGKMFINSSNTNDYFTIVFEKIQIQLLKMTRINFYR